MVSGVCVFDLDGTVVPNMKAKRKGRRRAGETAVKDMVNQCEAYGYEVAINTARSRVSSNIQKFLGELGIYMDDMPDGAVQTGRHSSRSKARGLHHIQEAYQVPAENVILFDDLLRNVKRARQNGYAGMHIRGGVMSHRDVQQGHGYFQTVSHLCTEHG